jgi:hypothetical protein
MPLIADRGLGWHLLLEILQPPTIRRARDGKVNKNVAWLPKRRVAPERPLVEDRERAAIVKFVQQLPLEDYRRLPSY